MGDDMPKYHEFARDADLYEEQRSLSSGSREGSAAAKRFRDSGRRLHGRHRRGARRNRKRGGQLRHEPRRAADQAAGTLHAARDRELRSGHRGPSRHRAFAARFCSRRNSTCACSPCPAAPIPTNFSRSKARRHTQKLLARSAALSRLPDRTRAENGPHHGRGKSRA